VGCFRRSGQVAPGRHAFNQLLAQGSPRLAGAPKPKSLLSDDSLNRIQWETARLRLPFASQGGPASRGESPGNPSVLSRKLHPATITGLENGARSAGGNGGEGPATGTGHQANATIQQKPALPVFIGHFRQPTVRSHRGPAAAA